MTPPADPSSTDSFSTDPPATDSLSTDPPATESSSTQPSERPRLSRRGLLSALGAAGTTAVAGCAGLLGGDERSLGRPRVVSDTPTEHVWEFPRDADAPVVQSYLDQRNRVPPGTASNAVRFQFGVTVFGDSGYRHDSFRAAFTAPAHPGAGRVPAPVYVKPPSGEWPSFRVFRDGDATVVALDGVETAGTIHFGFVVDPRTSPTPETLGVDFSVTAVEADGDGTAVADHHDTVPVVRDRE
ncbi:MAG: hypothetical protein ABEJ88_08095 [Halobacterium sp.]